MNSGQDQLPVAPLAVWALVLGIASLAFCCLPLAIPGIICGHLARSRVKQSPDALSGSGMALAGLITSYVSAVAFILACALGVIAAFAAPAVMKALDLQKTECSTNAGAAETGVDANQSE